MQSLCTLLPNLPPSGEAERFFFTSAHHADWCHHHDIDDLYATFNAEGMPFTVQFRPAAPQPNCDDRSWEHSCLTAQQRNPLLCLQ